LKRPKQSPETEQVLKQEHYLSQIFCPSYSHDKDNNKYFYKYIDSKRRAREDLYPLLDAKGNTVTMDQGKAEVLNSFFASVFTSKTDPQEPLVPEASLNGCSEEEDQVREHLSKLDRGL